MFESETRINQSRKEKLPNSLRVMSSVGVLKTQPEKMPGVFSQIYTCKDKPKFGGRAEKESALSIT